VPLLMPVTSRTPALSLPFLFPAQAQKEAFINEALLRIDAMIQPVVADETSAPPTDTVAGECHIVAAGASGAWAGREHQIAVWAGSEWLFLAPAEGAAVFDKAAGCSAFYRAATGWRRCAAPPPVAGGLVQDAELRSAFATVVEALHLGGFFT